MENKLNCWEFKECGRERGGKNAVLLGVCPAASAHLADGIHGGTSGGRCCWVTAAAKLGGTGWFDRCNSCDFYNLVKQEEQMKFSVTLVIMNTIKLHAASLAACNL